MTKYKKGRFLRLNVNGYGGIVWRIISIYYRVITEIVVVDIIVGSFYFDVNEIVGVWKIKGVDFVN